MVGTNGSGKSTLLNLIAGRLVPDSGTMEVGETVRIGYFCQETPILDPEQRVIDYVKDIGDSIQTREGKVTASQLLEQFLFPKDEQWAPIGRLSGGEKRRLFLLSVLAAAPNVLLLDEPTNDLDIQTLTILEDYLETFPGAVIAVSHDRYFLDKTANRLLEVGSEGEVTEYVGNYTDYLSARRERDKEKEKAPKAAPEKKAERPSGPQKLRFSYKEQREFETIGAAGVRDHRRRHRRPGGGDRRGEGRGGGQGQRLCGPPGAPGQAGGTGGRPGGEDGPLGLPQRPGRAHRQPVVSGRTSGRRWWPHSPGWP